jgi:hypothetical protein
MIKETNYLIVLIDYKMSNFIERTNLKCYKLPGHIRECKEEYRDWYEKAYQFWHDVMKSEMEKEGLEDIEAKLASDSLMLFEDIYILTVELDLRKKSVIPAAEPGSSRRDLGSSRFALDRDDKITKFCVSPIGFPVRHFMKFIENNQRFTSIPTFFFKCYSIFYSIIV